MENWDPSNYKKDDELCDYDKQRLQNISDRKKKYPPKKMSHKAEHKKQKTEEKIRKNESQKKSDAEPPAKKNFTRSAKKLNDSELDLLNETNFDFDLSENESSQDMSQSEVDESLNVSDLKEKPKINKKKSFKSNPAISKKETISKPVYEHEGYIYHFIRINKEEISG